MANDLLVDIKYVFYLFKIRRQQYKALVVSNYIKLHKDYTLEN